MAEKPCPQGRNLHLVAALRLAAITAGISPRSGPDDSLLDFSFEQQLARGQVAGAPTCQPGDVTAAINQWQSGPYGPPL